MPKKRKDEISLHNDYRQSAIEKEDVKIEIDSVLRSQFVYYLRLKNAKHWELPFTQDQERAINKISPLSNVSNKPVINL